MTNPQNIQDRASYSPVYFLDRFYDWCAIQDSTTHTPRADNLSERLAHQFFTSFIGPRGSLLDPKLTKLYQLFAKHDAKPNDFEAFMKFLAQWLNGDSKFYLKLASRNSIDSTISTEFDLEAASNRLAQAIEQNSVSHFDEQQITDNKKIIGFANGSQKAIKDQLNPSKNLSKELILNNSLNKYRQQLATIGEKRKLLPHFLAELAAFGSSTEDAIDILVFLTYLSKGGLALTDSEIADAKLYYVAKLAEKTFIEGFSGLIAGYYLGNISFEEIWQYVLEHLDYLEQDRELLPCAQFSPRLEFLLSLIRRQGDNAKQEELIQQIQPRFITYTLDQYQKKVDVDINVKNYIKDILKEKGYTINNHAPSSIPLAASTQAPTKNRDTNYLKRIIFTMVNGIKEGLFAVGRFLATALAWFVLVPSLLFAANYSFATQAVEDDCSQVREKKKISRQLNSKFGSNVAESLHAATPDPDMVAANQSTEVQAQTLAATLAHDVATTARQKFYHKSPLPKGQEQPRNSVTDSLRTYSKHYI